MVNYVNGSSVQAQFFLLENLQPFLRRKLSMFRTPIYIIDHVNFWNKSAEIINSPAAQGGWSLPMGWTY